MPKKDLTELIREKSRPKRWPTFFIIFVIYSSFWALSFFLKQFPYLILWIPVLFIVGGLQHHLAILMHEGAHFLLHPKRFFNDGIGQGLCAFPLGMHLKDYRYFHLQHHKFTGDPELDPEVAYYLKSEVGYGFQAKNLLRHLWQDLFLWNTIRSIAYLANFLGQKTKEGKIRSLNLSDFAWGILGLGLLFIVPYLLGAFQIAMILWVVSAVFITPVFIRWHAVGEHTGVNHPDEYKKTMTHLLPSWVNFFFYPLNSGLHLEHHLYPSVPWYHMKSFREERLLDPKYAKEAQELTVDGLFWGKRTILKVIFHA